MLRRSLVLLAAACYTVPAFAQASPDTSRSAGVLERDITGLLINVGWSWISPYGTFRSEIDRSPLSLTATVGVEFDDRYAGGVDATVLLLDQHSDAVSAPGERADVMTNMVTVMPFVRRGVPLGRQTFYAQAMAGLQLTITDAETDDGHGSGTSRQTLGSSFAPAVGAAVGITRDLRGTEVVGVQLRLVSAPRMSYLLYDADAERFTKRSTGTSYAALSFHVNLFLLVDFLAPCG